MALGGDRPGPAALAPPVFAAVVVALAVSWTYAKGAQWYPDTRHYAVRTLEILGRTREEAKAEAGRFLIEHGVTEPISVVDRKHARLFHPRVAYPLLSAPFVAAVGLGGLLVVPFVSTILACVLLWRLVSARAPPWVAAGTVALVAISRSFRLYSLAALTDGLGLALVAGFLLTLPTRRRPAGAPRAALALALAAALTREVTPYLFLASIAGWLWAARRGEPRSVAGWRRITFLIGAATVVSIVWTAAIARLGVLEQIELATQERGAEALRELPGALATALSRSGVALLRDWPLLIVFVAATIAVTRRRGGVEAALATGALLAAMGLFVLNPVSTKLRLQLPIVPFVAILAVHALGRARPERASDPPI